MGLAADVLAFFEEHRRCGDLDGGVEDERVWMTCECGASLVRPASGEDRAGSGRG
jgi:hypothetical protein